MHAVTVQMVCVMMNDPVACRMHWPLHPNLQVNYTGFKPYPRNAGNKMGPAGRDEPVNLAGVCFNPPSHRSVISLEAQDPRKFCVTVQVRHLSFAWQALCFTLSCCFMGTLLGSLTVAAAQ